jgi:hypothetical protein
MKNVDLSVDKDTKVRFLGEQGAVQFRAEMFNIMNHPNFGAPVSTLVALSTPAVVPCGGQVGAASVTCNGVTTNNPFPVLSTAGNINTTSTRSRQIQLSLKVIF